MPSHRILIADDQDSVRRLMSVVLEKEGYQPVCVADGQEAIDAFRAEPADLVLLDVRMPRVDGLEALRQLKEIRPEVPMILMTAYAGVETAVEALKQGAFDYIVKPFDVGDLKRLIRKALELSTLRELTPSLRCIDLPDSGEGHERILTDSPSMMEVCRNIAKVSQTNATVLIVGESGTGKELVAKAIHYHSKRATGPFIKVNCGALPESLLESTLFGHEKGAFTGAQSSQPGLFWRANHGTLLLDEVGEMSPALQVKFLRVLQEKEFEPIGGLRPVKTDFRLIAATNRKLEEMVEEGTFRRDLFYRLNVMTLSPPPLRERPADILLLARHFMQRFCAESDKKIIDFSPEAIAAMNAYPWPGNIRELSNAVERAVILAAGAFIGVEDLPAQIGQSDAHEGGAAPRTGEGSLKECVKNFERELIENTLRQHKGHRELTARALGVSKRTLLYKLQEHDLQGPGES
ncbi:sigma 54-interacting transcriptional regulator [Thauera sp.]|uniref:sigma 54-interacting transcriptional regulator n=1 Tax=Thauera sp. TaxID=1905334 RepID=UPI0039E6D6AB